MILDLSENIQRHIYLGCEEPSETAAVRRWLRPGMTVVDVGANVGYYTALAASMVGLNGSVLSIEPSPTAYSRLNTMVKQNHLNWVSTIRVALSDRPGSLTLHLQRESNHAPTAAPIPGASWMEVPVRTLDDVLREWEVQTVDLLKIDAMGHEPQILAGAEKVLSRRGVRAILCEFYYYWLAEQGHTVETLWRMLKGFGFVDPANNNPPRPDVNDRRFLVLQS
jgi:FkbM family methyltransferase